MTKEQKVIRAKVGLLERAKQLGNVSQACKMMGYSRDSFYRLSMSRDGPPAWRAGDLPNDPSPGPRDGSHRLTFRLAGRSAEPRQQRA
jgi:hypothetical protein